MKTAECYLLGGTGPNTIYKEVLTNLWETNP